MGTQGCQRPESSHKGEWYYEVTSTSAWNYSLIRKYLKEEELEKNFVVRKGREHSPLPMEPRECPYHDQNKGTDLTFMEYVQRFRRPRKFLHASQRTDG